MNRVWNFIYQVFQIPACKLNISRLLSKSAKCKPGYLYWTQLMISNWANDTFGPASSNARVAARANEEMAELLRCLTADDNDRKAGEEIADVVIVLARLATRMGFDLQTEINKKMEINVARQWNVANGHGYHVREKI